MRTATRLVLALGAVLVVVMTTYGFLAQRQRETLLGDAHLRDTELMARLIAGVLADAGRDGRVEDVRPLLGRAREHPEVVALALVGGDGEPVAGVLPPEDGCLESAVSAARARSAAAGTTECGGRVDWTVLPSGPGDAFLLVARRATALEAEVSSSRWRIAAVTLVLTLAAAAVIVLILRRTLTRPLQDMLEAVERFGDPRYRDPVSVPEYPGELGVLGAAFNELDRRLEEKTKWIVRETEERLQLEGKLRRVERFAAAGRITGGVAHELGSPLNAIGVRAEAVLEGRDVPPDARRHAEEIVEEVDRIAALVRSLLHIGRSGGLRPQDVDLGELVRTMAEDVEARAKEELGEGGVKVVLELPDDPVHVRGDPTLLRHAIRNLAANALQSVAEGEAAQTITLRLVRAADEVRVEVEDDGPGIPPDILPRVFEPFFTTKEVGEGTGLGLAIALGIAERHEGDLRISSEPGGGARAVLSLPLVRKELASAGAAAGSVVS